jgi:hypothetical protein
LALPLTLLPHPDFKLFERLDADKSGSVSSLEFLLYLRTTHAEKSARSMARADKWFETLMASLRRGCGCIELSGKQVRDSEAVYAMVAMQIAADGQLKKEELVEAMSGDFKVALPLS